MKRVIKTIMMGVDSAILRIAGIVLRVKIYRPLPRGIDPLYDLDRLLPGWNPEVIFDVGANVGQSAYSYAKRYPRARILSFEPAAATFSDLKRTMSRFPNVECLRIALSSEAGIGILAHGTRSSRNRLLASPATATPGKSKAAETVEKQRIDDFCRTNGINRISYLKIDTEGSDLDVLRGGEQMVCRGLIDVIDVEVGVGRDNELHVPLQEVWHHLDTRGYVIFGFYEQMHEWKRRLPYLRRTNIVFIRRTNIMELGRVP